MRKIMELQVEIFITCSYSTCINVQVFYSVKKYFFLFSIKTTKQKNPNPQNYFRTVSALVWELNPNTDTFTEYGSQQNNYPTCVMRILFTCLPLIWAWLLSWNLWHSGAPQRGQGLHQTWREQEMFEGPLLLYSEWSLMYPGPDRT